MSSKNQNSQEIKNAKNLNLNTNFLGGSGGEGAQNIWNALRITGGQATCVRLRTRGEEVSSFDDFCAYALCA